MISRYLLERRALKLKGPNSPKEKAKKKKDKGTFFKSKIAEAPNKCEECGAPLAGTMAINPAAVVAHIIPKRPAGGCPSVSTHKNNCFYGCDQCHHNFDHKGAKFVQNMSIFEVLKQRVATFYHLIPENERRNVPVYFRPSEKKPNGNKSRKRNSSSGKS